MKKIIQIVVGLIIVFWLYCIFTEYTVVIPVSKYYPMSSPVKNGDTIRPLANLDFKVGNWEAYIAISRSDFKDLNPSIKRVSLLNTTDFDVLNSMKGWTFKTTGGDIATAQSFIYIIHNGKMVFKSGIVLDNLNFGLQNSEFGWIVSLNNDTMINSVKGFNRTYLPIVFL